MHFSKTLHHYGASLHRTLKDQPLSNHRIEMNSFPSLGFQEADND
jgi:hypothetical protein